jgi:hypothetical protein
LFDVRLGWWLANPQGSMKNCRLASPNFGFYYLLCELLGATDDESDYVYLSDGGHFDLAQALRFGIAGWFVDRWKMLALEDMNHPRPGYQQKRSVIRKWLSDLRCHRVTMV